MVVDALKDKVINDFFRFLSRLEVGYVDDYQHILFTIAFIESQHIYENSQQIKEFILNN